MEETLKMENMVESEDWDGIVEYAARKLKDSKSETFYAEFYNLAQAYRGRQVEELFNLPQKGVQGLMLLPTPSVISDPILAYELFAMGNMSAAQHVAVGSLYQPESGTINYAMLKMLAKIELMRGQDKVADKYLKILSRQKDYREWAENARLDPDIERGRRKIACNWNFSSGGYVRDLFAILVSDPSDPLTMQYCLSYCLLSKDLESICGFVDRYLGSPALRTLPVPAQEALAFCAEEYVQNDAIGSPVNMDWCLAHGVTEDTFRRLGLFVDAVNQDDRWALMNFENTFWYYIMFTGI